MPTIAMGTAISLKHFMLAVICRPM